MAEFVDSCLKKKPQFYNEMLIFSKYLVCFIEMPLVTILKAKQRLTYEVSTTSFKI